MSPNSLHLWSACLSSPELFWTCVTSLRPKEDGKEEEEEEEEKREEEERERKTTE